MKNDLISRSALLQKIDEYKKPSIYHGGKVKEEPVLNLFLELHKATVRDIPAVDAVEVVRCKDCKHRLDEACCPMCFDEIYTYDDDGYWETDYITHDRTIDDGFCHLGERREDDATD